MHLCFTRRMKKFKSPAKHQTPLYRARCAYRDMSRRCGNPNGKNPAYVDVELRMTMEAWLEWSLPHYEKFIAENPGVSPSVSRNGDVGHYEIGNLEIVSLQENRRRQKTKLLVRPNGTKLCCTCRVVQPKENFCKNRTRADGLNHECRSCRAIRVREWRAKKKKAPTPR